jgi:hypothetical protein
MKKKEQNLSIQSESEPNIKDRQIKCLEDKKQVGVHYYESTCAVGLTGPDPILYNGKSYPFDWESIILHSDEK